MGNGEPELLWIVQGNLCGQYEKTNSNLAIFYGKQTVNTLQEVRSGNTEMGIGLQRGFLRKREGAYNDLADLLFSQNRLTEGQQVLDMLKEAEYHEFSGKSGKNDPRRSRVAYSPREAKWDKRFRELAQKLRKADSTSPEYATLKKEFDTLFEDVKKAFAPGVSGEPNRLDNTSPLQKPLGKLGKGTILVQYLMPQDRLWILVTTKDGMKARQVAVSAKEMKQKIEAFRESLSLGKDHRIAGEPEVRAMGKELYSQLIAPAAEELKTAQTLMLAPDGVLRYLPFAALHDGEQYLAQRYVLSNFTDMTKDRITDRPRGKWNFAGFGVSKAVGVMPALHSVPGELQGIRDNALPGTILLDEAFTGKALQTALQQSPPVVHVASHFVFEKGNEQASYLLLGDGSGLTLADIRSDYRFNNVDLVALSACETAVGGGEDRNGREVEGLGVLVQRQGAKGVLASLWSVNDEATGQFMRLFYGYRQRKGMSKAEALRQAQLAFIENRVPAALAEVGRGRHTDASGKAVERATPKAISPSHPYYWAPFILMGNWL
jgi:CHAT domain-containing protein